VAHAAKVAFTLLADVCGEEDPRGRGDVGVAQGGCQAEECGEAGGVVAGSRSKDAGAFFPWCCGGSGRKDGVEMGRQEGEGSVWGRFRCGEFGECVSGPVEMNVRESQGTKLLDEPLCAAALGEGWRWDREDLDQPDAKLRLMEVKPVERAMDGKRPGETADLELRVGGGRHQYSTSTRKSPWGGAVGPAARRSRAARMVGMASGESRWEAASTKVPTRLRTMWWRKPEPQTR
jgi:hypothetical protein